MLKTALNKIIRWAVASDDQPRELVAKETSALINTDSLYIQVIKAVNGHIVSVRASDRSPVYTDSSPAVDVYVGMDDDVMKTIATAIVANKLGG